MWVLCNLSPVVSHPQLLPHCLGYTSKNPMKGWSRSAPSCSIKGETKAQRSHEFCKATWTVIISSYNILPHQVYTTNRLEAEFAWSLREKDWKEKNPEDNSLSTQRYSLHWKIKNPPRFQVEEKKGVKYPQIKSNILAHHSHAPVTSKKRNKTLLLLSENLFKINKSQWNSGTL